MVHAPRTDRFGRPRKCSQVSRNAPEGCEIRWPPALAPQLCRRTAGADQMLRRARKPGRPAIQRRTSSATPSLERLASKATGCHITATLAACGPCRKRQTTRLNCFKSTGDSIEFAAAIRRGLAERPNSFISFSYHSCFSLGYRSMNTKLALSALVAALMLTACAKQEAASPDTAAAPPATTESAPAAPAADAPAAPAADAPAAAPADGTAAPPPADAPAAPPKQ